MEIISLCIMDFVKWGEGWNHNVGGFFLHVLVWREPCHTFGGYTRLFIVLRSLCWMWSLSNILVNTFRLYCCDILKFFFDINSNVVLVISQRPVQKQVGHCENNVSSLQTQMRLFIWQPFTCQDLMQWNVMTGLTMRRESQASQPPSHSWLCLDNFTVRQVSMDELFTLIRLG